MQLALGDVLQVLVDRQLNARSDVATLEAAVGVGRASLRIRMCPLAADLRVVVYSSRSSPCFIPTSEQ